MNYSLIKALMILRTECSRAIDAAQLDQPIPPGLSAALAALDEEFFSEPTQGPEQEELAALDVASLVRLRELATAMECFHAAHAIEAHLRIRGA